MKLRRCLECDSDEVFLWLGGSIGALYQCAACHYIGPVAIETVALQPFEDQFTSFWDFLKEGSFWSETGIANKMLFQT